ncbi:MAG: hypothetical protein FWD52_08855 [Candidatus Bathyarchaeota archaeon]|nr:hypothetical protein [Candidatus Termiticorpusculum sp.]
MSVAGLVFGCFYIKGFLWRFYDNIILLMLSNMCANLKESNIALIVKITKNKVYSQNLLLTFGKLGIYLWQDKWMLAYFSSGNKISNGKSM